MRAHPVNPVRRPYSKPEFLLEVYRWMEQFEKLNFCKPAIEEISGAFGISTSVTRYYLDRMEELKMGRQPRLVRQKTGKEITPSRSYILLPLEKADSTITTYLEKE